MRNKELRIYIKRLRTYIKKLRAGIKSLILSRFFDIVNLLIEYQIENESLKKNR